MGARFRATHQTPKKLALAVGLTRQGVSRITGGKAKAISYEHLASLARDPFANPEAVLNGAAQVIEEARCEGDVLELAERLDYWLTREQQHDGAEDCPQQRVAGVVGALAFMAETLTIPFRRKAVADLDAWIEAKTQDVDAALAALGHARALRAKLDPSGIH